MSAVLAEAAPPSARLGAPLALAPHGQSGLLLTFCGIDGSGKTSMIERTAAHLRAVGRVPVVTYTPSPRIRKNPLFRGLMNADTEELRSQVCVLGLCLQILGDLLQHARDSILPELRAGRDVLCDRYLFTTLAEVRARTSDPEVEAIVRRVAPRLPRPDLAFALELAPELAAERIRSRGNAGEKPLDAAFTAVQAAEYGRAARENELVRVSSAEPVHVAFASVRRHVDACLRGRAS